MIGLAKKKTVVNFSKPASLLPIMSNVQSNIGISSNKTSGGQLDINKQVSYQSKKEGAVV